MAWDAWVFARDEVTYLWLWKVIHGAGRNMHLDTGIGMIPLYIRLFILHFRFQEVYNSYMDN